MSDSHSSLSVIKSSPQTASSSGSLSPASSSSSPAPTSTPTPDQIVGGDVDKHGCIPSTGYTWCEPKQKCIREWKEECDSPAQGIETEAQEFCEQPNVAAVYVCSEYAKTDGSMEGAGSTFYKLEADGSWGNEIQCPVVAPDAMTEECVMLTIGSNCVETQIC